MSPDNTFDPIPNEITYIGETNPTLSYAYLRKDYKYKYYQLLSVYSGFICGFLIRMFIFY